MPEGRTMAENDNIEERLLGDEKDTENEMAWETLSEAGVRTYWKKNERTGSWEKVKKEAKIVKGKT